MSYATGLLEYSDDPLSDTTPSYTDRTSYLVGDVSWSDGKSRDLDEPQAGSITFRLKSPNGEWTPNSPDSLYPDSPFILRRFRWSVNSTAEGVWFPVAWQTTYPADTSYAVIEVTCVDGFELLSLDALDLLDPPTASSYEEVVMHDQPFAYYRQGNQFGTVMPAAAGPEGTILNTQLLNVPWIGSLITGDSDTTRFFGEVGGTAVYGRARIEDNPFIEQNAVSVECWALLATAANDSGPIMGGPFVTALTDLSFRLEMDSLLDVYRFEVVTGTSTVVTATSATAPNLLATHHVVGTWDGQAARIYVNGELEGETTGPGNLRAGNASEYIYVGGRPSVGSIDCFLDETAFYEYALTPERILAHYQAGAQRGFAEQTTGERITAVATSDLWAETEIQTGAHTVRPVMEHGQSKLEEIRAAAKTEMPESHFFFDGDGNPVYLGWEYKASTPYNEVQATFGPGGIGYQGIEPVYDDECFNEVTVGHEAAPGEESQHTATDTDSVSEFRRRAHAETGLILTDHHDAIGVATAILSKFSRPQQRFASLTINGNDSAARTHILARQIGDLIRVKGIGVNDTDVVTTILGRSKTLTAAGHLTCTWTLARGFDAAAGNWQLGIDGFSELNQTAVLA